MVPMHKLLNLSLKKFISFFYLELGRFVGGRLTNLILFLSKKMSHLIFGFFLMLGKAWLHEIMI